MSERISVKAVINDGNNKVDSITGFFYYIPIIGNKETNYICESYDIALIVGLGRKYEGVNSSFGKYACRMLEIKSLWADNDKGIISEGAVTVKEVANYNYESIKEDYYFVPYIDKKRTKFICESYDSALIIGLGEKYDNEGSKFYKFATRMLGCVL